MATRYKEGNLQSEEPLAAPITQIFPLESTVLIIEPKSKRPSNACETFCVHICTCMTMNTHVYTQSQRLALILISRCRVLSMAAFPTRGMFLKTQGVKKTHKSQETTKTYKMQKYPIPRLYKH